MRWVGEAEEGMRAEVDSGAGGPLLDADDVAGVHLVAEIGGLAVQGEVLPFGTNVPLGEHLSDGRSFDRDLLGLWIARSGRNLQGDRDACRGASLFLCHDRVAS